MKRKHKVTGWTREYRHDARLWEIIPTDNSGPRLIDFTSDPTDEDVCEIVIKQGEPLPEWAVQWLVTQTRKSRHQARQALRAMQYDADMNEWYGRGNW